MNRQTKYFNKQKSDRWFRRMLRHYNTVVEEAWEMFIWGGTPFH